MSNKTPIQKWFLVLSLALCAIAQFSIGSDLILRDADAMYKWGISPQGNYAALAYFAGILVALVGICSIALMYLILKGKEIAQHLSTAFGTIVLLSGIAFGLSSSLGRMMEMLFIIYASLGGLILLGCYFMHLKKF